MLSRCWIPTRWPSWVWLTVLAVGFALRFPIHFWLSPPYLMDFEVYQITAQRVAGGLGAQLYEPTTSPLMLFKYAPCWVVLWLPLAWMPPAHGAVAWAASTVLWLILGCAGALHLCRAAGLRSPPWLPLAAVLLLLRPLSAEFLNGQVDLLWGALVIGFLVAELHGQAWWSALALASAISLKLPAAIVLAYLVCRGRWACAVRALAVFAAVNLLSILLIAPSHGVELLGAWGDVLWSSGSSRAFEIGNQNLVALLGRLFSEDGYHLNLLSLPTSAIWCLATAAVGVLFGFVFVGPRRFVFEGALVMVVMVLGSPTVWIATYSALLFPAMLAAACALTDPPRRWSRFPEMAAGALVLLGSLMTHSSFWKALGIRYFRGESYVFLVLMVLPWWALALFGYLWSRRGAAPGTSGS